MPSYVRTRLLTAREFAVEELAKLKVSHPAYDQAVVENFRRLIPFDYYFFAGVNLDRCHAGDNILLMSDMPPSGIEAYHKSGLVQADPLVTRVTPEQPILAWSDVPADALESADVKRLVALLEQHNIPPRLMISLWNADNTFYGTVGFARRSPFLPEEIAVLAWWGVRLHAALSEPILEGFNQQIGITHSERKCLELASRGATSDDIARQLGISAETVNSHFKSAIKKLAAKSRTHAIADAMRLKLERFPF